MIHNFSNNMLINKVTREEQINGKNLPLLADICCHLEQLPEKEVSGDDDAHAFNISRTISVVEKCTNL